ncbi:MAG: hypothetical protein JXA42_05620 [Anaerolineales bacterium]|nr:hypothetical protein [Anaerolineales bacterium]
MKNFLIFMFFLIILVALAGSIVANVYQYVYQQQELSRAVGIQNARADRIGTLEAELGATQTQLRESERQAATLEAYSDDPLIPSPTPPTLPVVQIDSPLPGSRFKEGEEVVVRWNAWNPDTINMVTCRVDGVIVEKTPGSGQKSLQGEFVWIAVGIGDHLFEVVATNPIDQESEPATVQIEVVAAYEGGQLLDPETIDIMDTIQEQVSILRGLEPTTEIARTIYTQDELRQFVLLELEEDFSPDEARNSALEMAAFDFLPVDIDLVTLMEELYTEQIAGFYDTDTQSFTIVDEDAVMGPMEKATYAHEFTHALQDQHYDLDLLDPEDNDDDASMAVTALIEGDAMMIMQQYMMAYMDSDEIFQLLSESMETESSILDSSPLVIQEQMMFPYEEGLLFVDYLYSEGGYPGIDAAFANPPQSTEQILHPERYLAGESPQIISLPPLTGTLGTDWQFVDENVLGEFFLRVYLEQYVDPQAAAEAADGWGGDRYAVYYRPENDDLVLVYRIVWDSESEAKEFHSTFRTLGRNRFGVGPDEDTCWERQDAICIYLQGDETLLVRAPNRDVITSIEPLFPEITR